MALSWVGYDAVDVSPRSKKTGGSSFLADDKAISRQIDELQRVSDTERDKKLGRDYFDEIADFYDLEQGVSAFPSFRPKVQIPQLQTLVLNEATDITDSSPKIYITKDGRRDEAREKYYQANWKQGAYNNRILESFIWAMLSNLGFLQIGFSPSARHGKGMTWVDMRKPASVHPDPYTTNDKDWSYVVIEDGMYIDEVYRRWPEKGRYVRPRVYAASDTDPAGSLDQSLEFPEYSPLSNSMDYESKKIFRDNRVRVRHCYMFDNTRERVKEYAGSKSDALGLVHPRFQYTYPDGRWITECEGVILADGNNWCPQLPDDERGTFPLVRLAAMPTITSFWGPPPVKLTRSLQHLSERMYTQAFENMYRLNNGVVIVKNNSGLSVDGIGMLPGEILMVNAQSDKPIEVIWPKELPTQMINVPATLLALQKELQGFTQSRQGQPGQGNISADLYDATLWQSQPQTRMRARLLSEALQRLAQIVFYVNARYLTMPHKVFDTDRGEPLFREWEPVSSESLGEYDAQLDEGSLQVLSATALRSVMAALSKSGMVPTKFVLEQLGVPNSEELAEENLREKELAAMGKLRRPR